jgi:hypothetical protein
MDAMIKSDVMETAGAVATAMRRALWNYYPTDEGNPITERYLTVYLSHSFLNVGMLVYPEHWLSEEDSDCRIDFALVDPVRSFALACECKVLNTPAKAAAFAEDATRLRSFKLRTQTDGSEPKEILHLLAALTYTPGVTRLWNSASAADSELDGDGWAALAKELKTFDLRQVIPVVTKEQDGYELSLMAAIRPV